MCVYLIEAECEEVQHIRQLAVMISIEELLQLGMLNLTIICLYYYLNRLYIHVLFDELILTGEQDRH